MNLKSDANAHSGALPLLSCPFCGEAAEFERTGTNRRSCQVSCTMCGTHHESSDKFERSGQSWNQRAKFGAVDVMRLRDWLGVKGGDISEDVWQGMDDKTRRLYVCDLLEVAR